MQVYIEVVVACWADKGLLCRFELHKKTAERCLIDEWGGSVKCVE